MLKQVVGLFSSFVAAVIVALILAVLVRLSWGPRKGAVPLTRIDPASSRADKVLRKA